MNDQQSKLQGFAKLSPETVKAIASKGGKAAPAASRSFSQSSELASRAGKLGAQARIRNSWEKKKHLLDRQGPGTDVDGI